MQIDIDKIYTYLDTFMTHTVSCLLLSPSALGGFLENIKRGMVQHPQLALLNGPDKEIIITKFHIATHEILSL